jgi:hypothetical protein
MKRAKSRKTARRSMDRSPYERFRSGLPLQQLTLSTHFSYEFEEGAVEGGKLLKRFK